MSEKKHTYEAAGVSVDRGNQAVEWIKPLALSTRRPEVVADIGGFAGGFRVDDAELLAGADGVGSKLLLAKELDQLDTIGVDLVAMNVNDILASGGEPLFFLDYIAMGYLDPARVRRLVGGVAAGCREAGCALLGGETSEMPDLYGSDEFDLSGFAVGRRRHRASAPQSGDVVLGLASAGFHANGYQLIRAIVKARGESWTATPPQLEGETLGAVLLRPTRIYVNPVMRLWDTVEVRAMAHITGGGLLENLPRTLGGLGARLNAAAWTWPEEIRLIQEWGAVDQAEMLRTFNCGIGFTVVVAPDHEARALEMLASLGVPAFSIGRVEDEPGVRVS